MKTEYLKKLGFDKAADELHKEQEFNRKLSIAYLTFKIAKEEHIAAFNEKLKTRTLETTGTKGKDLTEKYERLSETNIKNYSQIPPKEVLEKLEAAQELNCFDYYEIAKIESVVEYKDPILFGRIIGCSDRFFIAEWDNDIHIEDLIGK